MTLADDKAALRKDLYARRKAAREAGAGAAEAARDRFLTEGFAGASSVVAGYRPIRTELDPTPLMEALHASGLTLCVPVIVAEGAPLSFREWTPGCAMTAGAFGAEVPAAGAWLEPDLLIVPLVGFDRGCWRLGYGGGFYDRTLTRLRAIRPTTAVGFAFAAQETGAVPREETDQPLDAVVTEAGTLRR